MYCWRGASIIFGLLLVIACSHPLEIKGEGDILSASGMRDCHLEDFRAGVESCSKNLVVGDYRETYHAVPREGWEFVSWENCFDEGSALDQCRLDFDAGTVEKFWGETAAPLVAVFQQLDDSTSSDNNPDSARCDWQRGWAKDVRGGLGGKVIPVTTLEPDGPGSLQAALDTQGPRVIVFEVGGVIDLGAKPLLVRNPYVTVAGQTAPSPGITLIRGWLSIETHDVVVQHLRVRPGEAGQAVGWEPDGIATYSAHNVIIDHCSLSWAVDENLSASGPRFEGATPDEWRLGTSHRVTFSRNIVAEGLSNSTHKNGEHSKGSLIHDNATEILIWGNLYASNVDRNPLFKGGARGAIVNNFVANPGRYAVSYGLVHSEWGARPYETGMLSVVGNVFHLGPDSTAPSNSAFMHIGVGPVEVFLKDNVAADLQGEPLKMIGGSASGLVERSEPPVWPAGLVAQPSAEVLQTLADDVGARPWDRDAIDARIVNEALTGTGSHIDHESEGGGYPQHAPTSAAFDPARWDACFERIP